MKNKEKYIGLSFFNKVLGIKNIKTKINSIYSDYKKNNTEYVNYYTYTDENIIINPIHNIIFILKNFEKELYRLNGVTIKNILETINIDDYILMLENKPNSEILRKIGFLIEVFLEKKLKLSDTFEIKKNNVFLLNNDIFITNNDSSEVNKKYKVVDNSLGKIGVFNPILIREELNIDIFNSDFNKNLENINNGFDSEIIEKAINYLYTKETKGSLEIEGERFNQNKNRGFLKLISNIPTGEDLTKEKLIEYYNIIYSDNKIDYRTNQNYIGSGNGMMGENIIEYISPKQDNINELIDSMVFFYKKNKEYLNPLLLATILSTQFVLIHPFDDGNGRTSRFLLQYSLLNSGIGKIGDNKIILPVSAYIQLNKSLYYKKLEHISSELIDFIDFEEKENGEISVLNDTKLVYQNLDFTDISNYFYDVLNDSINIDYKKELTYIDKFYKIYNFIDTNYNISSNNISFITKNIIDNDGILSNNKIKVLEKRGVNLELLKGIEKELENI